ncbi:hypothetical protein N431DRAFT_335138 [Stipitochalara longipes BDJ]|nr:hypothetical protein N431DRAFT_335138 [Stipitochalara longipes BDJ]
MIAKFICLSSLLFLARLGMGEGQLAERVPQLLNQRNSFLGGISLYAETPTTGVAGVCPSYTQTCPGSCCPDGCCPSGTFCFVNGDYCCPTSIGAVSPYFCCEPNQIALLPNLCVANSGPFPAASLAPSGIQVGSGSLASTVTSLITISSAPSATSARASITTQTVSIAGPEPSSPSNLKGSSNSKSGLSTGAKVGIGIGVGVAVLLLLGLCISKCFARRKQKSNEKGPPEPPPAYTSEHAGSRFETHMIGGGDARQWTARGNYPEHVSEMPGAEAQMRHELGAK